MSNEYIEKSIIAFLTNRRPIHESALIESFQWTGKPYTVVQQMIADGKLQITSDRIISCDKTSHKKPG